MAMVASLSPAPETFLAVALGRLPITKGPGPLTARISAASNRSTLLNNHFQPNNEHVADFYIESITNHYAKLVHITNIDGRGYAFPCDDVPAPNDVDQSGFVRRRPQAFTISIG